MVVLFVVLFATLSIHSPVKPRNLLNELITLQLLGRTGEDCSVFTRRPPQLISVVNDGKCDLKTTPCKQVIVVGSGFNNSRDLRCSVSRIKVLIELYLH